MIDSSRSNDVTGDDSHTYTSGNTTKRSVSMPNTAVLVIASLTSIIIQSHKGQFTLHQ